MGNCFSCGQQFDLSEKGVLRRYKEASIRTGAIYWFYKINGSKLKITTSDGFKRVRERNKEAFAKKEVEFGYIQEFIDSSLSPFPANSQGR